MVSRNPQASLPREKLSSREKRCLKDAKRRVAKVRIGQLEKVFRTLSGQLGHLHEDAAQRAHHRAAVLASVPEAFNQTVELQRAMDPGAVETIHRTRIAFKKFRYMVEALQPLFDGITAERLITMQAYQSMMGDVQDSEVFLDRLDRAPGEGDFRLEAFHQALTQLQTVSASRTERVLSALSDPTVEPIPAATTKAACGAWPGK